MIWSLPDINQSTCSVIKSIRSTLMDPIKSTSCQLIFSISIPNKIFSLVIAELRAVGVFISTVRDVPTKKFVFFEQLTLTEHQTTRTVRSFHFQRTSRKQSEQLTPSERSVHSEHYRLPNSTNCPNKSEHLCLGYMTWYQKIKYSGDKSVTKMYLRNWKVFFVYYSTFVLFIDSKIKLTKSIFCHII